MIKAGHPRRLTGKFGKRDVIVHGTDPFNAETEPAALAEGAITATEAFYVRNHGAVPEAGEWRLRVQGAVERPLDLSLATLREALPEYTVTATLQCAGWSSQRASTDGAARSSTINASGNASAVAILRPTAQT